MPTYLISTKEKKNVREIEIWTKREDASKKAIRTEIFRWGEWSLELDNVGEIDLENKEGLDIGSFTDAELISHDDSCDVIWEFSENISKQEQKQIFDARENSSHEGLENIGWSQEIETWFYGPLDIEEC